ncbi:MAG: hypothetical protein J6B64_04030 [Bacilli bacterium]|nr:hypothetical protein [Bacilli bacterium]MBP3921209.1 hypothetical protein [Bacilli bacterium]
MSDIEIINQKLGTNYNSLGEIYSLKEALTVCLKDDRLFRRVSYFTSDTWTNENQELLASVLEDYMKKAGYNPKIKRITSSQLLTNAYKYGLNITYYATAESLNEENIKLAYEKNKYDSFLFRDSPLALKVYLENNYNYNIDFRTYTWNEENANLYIKKISDFPRINSFYSNKICIKEVIKNHNFRLMNNFYFDNSKDIFDNEIGNLLYQEMIKFPDDIVEIKAYLFNGLQPYYLKGLLKTNRLDLVEKAINNKSLTEENINLLADNLENYLKMTNNKLNNYLSNNDVILHKLIELGRIDIINDNFKLVNWSEENLRLYFNLNLDDKYYKRFEHNPLALKVYILGNYKFNIPFTNFNEKIVWTEENIELYFVFLKKMNPDDITISSFTNIENYPNRCLEHNVFKYLDKSYKEINYELLCKKIREFPNEEFVLRNEYVNPDVLETLIDVNNYSLFYKHTHWINEINESTYMLFSEKIEDYLNQNYDIPSSLKKSPIILKKLIELNFFDKINGFSTWNTETIALIANKYMNGKLVLDEIPCKSERYLHYALYNLDVFKKGWYSSLYSKYNDPFFRYLEENKIGDITELLIYFENKNILDEYIKDGYLTDKFKEILIFNHGYQCYCRDSGIDIFKNINDLVLLAYLKCAYKVSNLQNGIFINETNYKEYFNEQGPKQELYDFLFNPNSIDTFKTLIEQYPNDKIDELKIYAVDKFINIENIKIKKLCFEYFKEHYEVMNNKKVDDLLNLTYRIEYSNSLEMHQFQEQILSNILDNDNPYEKLDKIENIFLKENIPMFSKIFLGFKILYPKLSKLDKNGFELFNFSEYSRISPDLLIADPNNKRMQLYKKIVNGDKTKIRFQLIFNDLLRCAICSNNDSLNKYLNILKNGNEIINKMQENNYIIDNLTIEEQKILNTFVDYLSTIYENITDKKIKNMNLTDRCNYLTNYFKPTNKYSLADRVVRSFGYFAGIDSLEQIFKMINDIQNKAQEENKVFEKQLEKKVYKLDDGNLLRCIGYFNILGSSLENGNVCKELLGSFIGKSESDTTPLDVDFTLIKGEDNLYSSIDGTPTGWGFGNIFIILKDNITVTRDKDGNILDTIYDPMKMEVFGTHTKSGGHETHWGGRSGFSKTDIKCFLYKKMIEINKDKPYNDDGSVNYVSNNVFNDLPLVKFEIAKHGLYIPVVDLSGKLIFTEDEYNNIRSKMMGLSHYGCNEYQIDKDSLYFDGIEKLLDSMNNDRRRVDLIRKKIYKRIEEIITNSEYGFDIQTVNNVFNGDLSSGICELLETGSTSRFSNIPEDCDFDFMLKMDRKYTINQKIVTQIIDILKKELKPTDMIPAKKNRFRGTGITLSDFSGLKIDISIDQRKNDNTYSSEMCLNDRYESIKKQYPDCYPLVLANIVKAKQILKEKHVYKSLEGGMGGIGVENWILQNGGSLKLAAKDFINHAYKNGTLIDYDEFKNIYHVFDFGCNHEPREKIKNVYYPFDDYIADNLTKEKYTEMAEILKKYIDEIELKPSKSI